MVKQQRFFHLLFYFFTISIVVMGCSKSIASNADVDFKQYEDKNNHFKINYPSIWSVDKSQPNVDVMFNVPKENEHDKYTENISVASTTLSAEATLPIEKYKDGIIESTKKQSPGLEVLSTTALQINHKSAFQMLCKGKRDDTDLAYKITYFIDGKKGYVITFTCLYGDSDKYSPVVDKMINSFVITD